jgi:hypothetical protein
MVLKISPFPTHGGSDESQRDRKGIGLKNGDQPNDAALLAPGLDFVRGEWVSEGVVEKSTENRRVLRLWELLRLAAL